MKKLTDIIFKVLIAFMLSTAIAAIGKLLFEIVVNTSSIKWP